MIDPDHAYWLDLVGRPLAVLLEHSAYDKHSQVRQLTFFREHIMPSLGPRPRSTMQLVWNSFMTDNGFPVELGICWKSGGEVSVKLSIEPISKTAGTSSDPMNIHQITTLLASIGTACPETHDMQWFRAMAQIICIHEVLEAPCYRQSLPPNYSQYFAGVDLGDNQPVARAYLIPGLKASKTGSPKLDLVNQAIQKIGSQLQDPWVMITAYLTSPQTLCSTAPEVEIIAVDCLEPAKSRLKVYMRTHKTSFEAVKDVLLLGGRLQSQISEETIEALSQLWRLILRLPDSGMDEGWDTRDLPHVEHRTAGILFYFELRPGQSVPWPKVYIPVRHYCKNDELVVEGMEQFMELHENFFGDWAAKGKYAAAIREFGAIESLEQSRGLHTYVAFAVKQTGWELHSYFNPGWRVSSSSHGE